VNQASAWRTVLAVAILIGFAALGIRLIPAYLQSWKFQGYLNDISEDPDSAKLAPAVLEARVLNKAASIGVPLHLGDVQVERQNRGIHIRALYAVHIDLALYSVDLHFHPEAGGA